MWEHIDKTTTQIFVQQKIEEFKQFSEVRRKKKMQIPYEIPRGGIATFHCTDEDPGVSIPDYSIIISTTRIPHINKLKIQRRVGEVFEEVQGIEEFSTWLINTKKWKLEQRLCYWHTEELTLFITHREIGQVKIVYDQVTWDYYEPDWKMNFEIFQIPTPDGNDSASSGDDSIPARTAAPNDLPFHKYGIKALKV